MTDRLPSGVILGRVALPSALTPLVQPASFSAADPLVAPHVAHPWFRAQAARQLNLPLAPPGREAWRGEPGRVVTIAPEALDRHWLTVAPTGTGKSYLMALAVRQQLEAGCSAVILDGKGDLVDLVLYQAQAIGLAPAQIKVVSPRYPYVPGWNPFLEGIPPAQAAADLVAVFERATSSWGHRLQNLLTCALIVVAAHRRSLWELVRLLEDDAFRSALLALPTPEAQTPPYREAAGFFRHEYDQWSRAARTEASGPVLNRSRAFLRNSFLLALLCARENSISLADLWQRQSVVLVHLDRSRLEEEGAHLLGGLMANLLLRTALRTRGPQKVVLAVDELAVVEHFVGAALSDIATVARSQGLRLLCGTQHLAQLSDTLRTTLLANCAVQTFYRLEIEDARLVGAAFAAGTEPRLLRADVGRQTIPHSGGEAALVHSRRLLRAPDGRRLTIGRATWARLHDTFKSRTAPAVTPLECLYALARLEGLSSLKVKAPDGSGLHEVRAYVAGLPPESYWIEGPAPLALVVAFPRPHFTGVERLSEAEAARVWTQVLASLPPRHCALRVKGQGGVVQVATLPYERTDALVSFLGACLEANGRPPSDARAMVAEREAALMALTRGTHAFRTRPVGSGDAAERAEGPGALDEAAAPEDEEPVAEDGSLA